MNSQNLSVRIQSNQPNSQHYNEYSNTGYYNNGNESEGSHPPSRLHDEGDNRQSQGGELQNLSLSGVGGHKYPNLDSQGRRLEN